MHFLYLTLKDLIQVLSVFSCFPSSLVGSLTAAFMDWVYVTC